MVRTPLIFLSYSRNSDLAAANEFLAQLTAAGLSVFKDDVSLRSGDRWLDRLQSVLATCTAFVVLVGRDGVQRWVGAEVAVALDRNISAHDESQRLPIYPILIGDTPARALPPLLALFQAASWVPATDIPTDVRDALLAHRQRLATQVDFTGCPFRGLGAFKREHAHLFFGRRKETLEALGYLGDQQQTAPDQLRGGNAQGYYRWLQIEGHSGSGKSSLMQAGLLPMIERGALWARTGYSQWRVLEPIVPGGDPLTRLAEKFEHAFGAEDKPDILTRSERFLRDPRSLALDLRGLKKPDTAFLLVIDQFEELYTLASVDERVAFDRVLAHALQDPECPLFVISTIRADFLDRIDQLPALKALYNARCKRYLLSTISSDGLRDAIELPARLAGLDVSQVVAAMREQAADEPGALPLVENALLQLWQQRTNGKLSGEQFHDRGGLVGMLSSGADALLAHIDRVVPKGKAAALELMLALSSYQRDGRHTRRRITYADAIQAAGNGNDFLGAKVLGMLAGDRSDEMSSEVDGGSLRLVTTSVEKTATGDVVYVDLIHETLLRMRGRNNAGTGEPYWPVLFQFIEANKDRDRLRDRLDERLEAQQRSGRWWRWRHIAGWNELRKFRRLRVAPRSDAGRFLTHSLRAQALFALVLVAFIAMTWWREIENFGAKITNTAIYLAVLPFWYAEVWAPIPTTVALPPLVLGTTFDMGCKPGRDDIDGSCPSDEPLQKVAMPAPCICSSNRSRTPRPWQGLTSVRDSSARRVCRRLMSIRR